MLIEKFLIPKKYSEVKEGAYKKAKNLTQISIFWAWLK